MAVYSLHTFQRLPATLDKAWDFFSDPANLSLITPPGLGFKIISRIGRDGNDRDSGGPSSNSRIYAGQIIEYTLRPLPFWTTYWMTEITHVVDDVYFIDEQRFGPYGLWHHQHHFREIDGGVEMRDIVHYKIPFWWIGDLANSLFVRRQLDGIFKYRYRKVEEIFGKF